MIRLTPRHGAVLLVSLAALVAGGSLAKGHNARANALLPLKADAERSLDLWKALDLLVREPGTRILDRRPPDSYAAWHIPGSVNLPGAGEAELRQALSQAPAVLMVATQDIVADEAVAAVRTAQPNARVHALKDGPRAWYLALELPVGMFREEAAPAGYAEALATLKAHLAQPAPKTRDAALEALQTLARLNVQPTLLKAGKKAAPAGGAKPLAGGCG